MFRCTDEHEQLRAQIREFAESEIKPYAFQWDRESHFPRDVVEKMGQKGWLGIPYPKEYGGMGKDILSYSIAVEELSRVDGGTARFAIAARNARCRKDDRDRHARRLCGQSVRPRHPA